LTDSSITVIGAGLDLGLVKDATGLVFVARNDDRYTVREAIGFKRKPKSPVLSLDILCPQICAVCKRLGVDTLWADGHEYHEARSKCEKLGVSLLLFPSTEKLAAWAFTRGVLTDGRLIVPAFATQLKKELRSIGHKLTAGGKIDIVQPRRGGTHADLASALNLALYGAQHATTNHNPPPPPWVGPAYDSLGCGFESLDEYDTPEWIDMADWFRKATAR